MTKQTTVLIAILALIAGGMSMLTPEGNPVAYAAPRIQETESPRQTPTNEPRSTSTPEPPPTNTPVEEPTSTPLPGPPTSAPGGESIRTPEPTSKPTKPKPSGSSDSTEPPAPAATESTGLDLIPTTGIGSIGGWTLGLTGLVLVCILVVARRLRIGKRTRKGRNGTAGESVNHHHPHE